MAILHLIEEGLSVQLRSVRVKGEVPAVSTGAPSGGRIRGMNLRALLLLLVLPSLAWSQSIEVNLFAKYEDEPIADLVSLLELAGSFKVEIDPELEDREVTVEFKGETPLAALRKVAKVMKVGLTEVRANRYRLAPRGPSTQSADEKPAEEPEWAKAVREKLLETEMDGEFDEEKLAVVLAKVSKAAGVFICLDPDVARVRSEEKRTISMTPVPNPTPAMAVLTGALEWAQLEYELRWGGVFVSLPLRIEKLGEHRLTAAAKLPAKSVDLKLGRCALIAALKKTAKLGGVKIRYRSKDLRGLPRVDLLGEKVRLADAFGAILIPRGLDLVAEDGAFAVRPR
jgi:hypothetical protein